VQQVLNQASDRYRRCARRIRGLHGDKPGELYRSLRDLSERYDSTYPVYSDRVAEIRAATPADGFSSQIVERICNGVLPYSDRLDLLDEAGKVGIGRFDANLIIAAVQHRCATQSQPGAPRAKFKIPALELMAAFLVVQVLILFLAWIVFLR